jgi:hypothetical protein
MGAKPPRKRGGLSVASLSNCGMKKNAEKSFTTETRRRREIPAGLEPLHSPYVFYGSIL